MLLLSPIDDAIAKHFGQILTDLVFLEDFDEVLEHRPYTNGWLVNSGDLLVETNEIFSVSI